MTISRDDSIGIVGAGLSGLLLANQLIARGYEVTLFGEKDNRNQILGSWRNAATPSPQKHYVLGNWHSWEFQFNNQKFLQKGAKYHYEVIDGKAMKLDIENSLQRVSNCTRILENIASIKRHDRGHEVSFESGRQSVPVDFLVDTRPPFRATSCCVQQFMGLYVNIAPSDIGLDKPLIMDYGSCGTEKDNSAFIYALPLSNGRVLIEATTFDVKVRNDSFFLRNIESWWSLRTEQNLKDKIECKESGILPMGKIKPRFNPENSFGSAGGATRPATGYTLVGIERQLQTTDLWTISGGIPKFEFSKLSQFMDSKFLRVLRNEPSSMREIFHEMARGMTGDEFARFLSDRFNLRIAAKVIYKMPKRLFLRNLFR